MLGKCGSVLLTSELFIQQLIQLVISQVYLLYSIFCCQCVRPMVGLAALVRKVHVYEVLLKLMASLDSLVIQLLLMVLQLAVLYYAKFSAIFMQIHAKLSYCAINVCSTCLFVEM
jgi:hypothetical protein